MFRPRSLFLLLTCTRLLFRTDTNDLTGGARRGKGAMVTSHTCFVLREGPAGWGGLPTTAAELPTPPRPLELQGPTARCCVKQHAGGCGRLQRETRAARDSPSTS